MTTSNRIVSVLSLGLLFAAGCGDGTGDTPPDMAVSDPRCQPLAACGKACIQDSECVSAGDVGQCIRVAAGTFCIPSCSPGRTSCPSGFECKAVNESFRCIKPCQGNNDCTESHSSCCSGFCVNLDTDRRNCASCGNACTELPNAVVACEAGLCGIGSCKPGWSDCDFDDKTGCEVDVSRDTRNCGGCDLTCAEPAGGTATCVDRKCGIQCSAGRADCNLDTRDGCETDTLHDANNCGSCNTVCPNGGACTNGKC